MNREILIDFLACEAEYSEDYLKECSNLQLFDLWLHWQGIHGYTYDIIDMVHNLHI